MRVAEAAVRAKNDTHKTVLVFSNFSVGLEAQVETYLSENGIPYLQGTPETLRAMRAIEQYAAFKRKVKVAATAGCPSPANLEEWRKRLEEPGAVVDECEGRKLLCD